MNLVYSQFGGEQEGFFAERRLVWDLDERGCDLLGSKLMGTVGFGGCAEKKIPSPMMTAMERFSEGMAEGWASVETEKSRLDGKNDAFRDMRAILLNNPALLRQYMGTREEIREKVF
ncbi:hypothetical protein KKG71_00525 [Patescibacteria group bacterium]|nr:hypothetical protein [Patescibacteria group bacterium]